MSPRQSSFQTHTLAFGLPPFLLEVDYTILKTYSVLPQYWNLLTFCCSSCFQLLVWIGLNLKSSKDFVYFILFDRLYSVHEIKSLVHQFHNLSCLFFYYFWDDLAVAVVLLPPPPFIKIKIELFLHISALSI